MGWGRLGGAEETDIYEIPSNYGPAPPHLTSLKRVGETEMKRLAKDIKLERGRVRI